MSQRSEKGPTPAEALTPGIDSYKTETYNKRDQQRVRLQVTLSGDFNRHWQHQWAFEMFRAKAANSPPPFTQESEFYLPSNTTISLETELDRHILETDSIRVKKRNRKRSYTNFGRYPTGYFLDFERPDGKRELRMVRFLENGVKIILWSTQEKGGLIPRWSHLSAEVSVRISERVSEEKARECLEVFAHAPY